jgi:hypothetical protein
MKIDLRKELKHLYAPSAKDVIAVDVPEMNFLMIDGMGDPNTSQEYRNAVEALFSLSYAIKFITKKEKSIDYAVMPLEGLWWMDDMTRFTMENKNEWKWTNMIMQPEHVTKEAVNKALEQMRKKDLPSLPKIRFEAFNEGPSAQIMHIGSYSAEGPAIERIHNFIKKQGYKLSGKHHEIYLSDPRRSTPDKMKTVVRQPMSLAH